MIMMMKIIMTQMVIWMIVMMIMSLVLVMMIIGLVLVMLIMSLVLVMMIMGRMILITLNLLGKKNLNQGLERKNLLKSINSEVPMTLMN